MKPMLFDTEMVKALLEGRKTVTRSVAFVREDLFEPGKSFPTEIKMCNSWPKDILYVKETWNCLPIPEPLQGTSQTYWYKADGESQGDKWRPPIQMPQEAARIFLLVKNIRLERLQDIKESGTDSAQAEGFVSDIDLVTGDGKSATKHFAEFWDKKIKPAEIGKYGWNANLWVWVISFERIYKADAEKMEVEKI